MEFRNDKSCVLDQAYCKRSISEYEGVIDIDKKLG